MWPFKPKPVQQVQLKTIVRDRCEVTSAQWRSSGEHVSSASAIVGSETFRLMLDCVSNSGPHHWVLPADASVDQRAAHQARIEGYQMALTDLKLLGTLEQAKHEPLIADFQPEILEAPPTL